MNILFLLDVYNLSLVFLFLYLKKYMTGANRKMGDKDVSQFATFILYILYFHFAVLVFLQNLDFLLNVNRTNILKCEGGKNEESKLKVTI